MYIKIFGELQEGQPKNNKQTNKFQIKFMAAAV